MVSIRQAFRSPAPGESDERLRFLVPVAGNDSDTNLLSYVEKIARKKHALITVIYVVEVDQALPLDAELPAEVTKGEAVLHDARELIARNPDAKGCRVNTDLLQARSAGPAIVDEAIMQESDVIFMSAQVTKKHGKRTCGDTIDYVMRNAPCEVMILRQAMNNTLLEDLDLELEVE